MPSRDHKVTIHGEEWLLRFTRLRGTANGYAYLPDARKAKAGSRKLSHKILIDTRLPHGSRAQLETIIHEFLHASFPTASEEHVGEAGRDLARILWELSWRLNETA
jgi:hypothetical protein